MNTGMRRKRAMNQDKLTWSFLDVGEKHQILNLTSIPQNIDANDKTKKSFLMPFTTCLKSMPFLKTKNIENDLRKLLENI